MVVVRFTRPCPPYMPGETAGFDGEAASRYVEAGAAVYEAATDRLDPPVAAATVPAPPAATVMTSPVKPGRRGR